MLKIIKREDLNSELAFVSVEAKDIAAQLKPGQFVTITAKDPLRRLPLRVADWDKDCGSLDFVFLKTGLADTLPERITGPFGKASKIDKLGEIYFIIDQAGITGAYPILKAFKEYENRIITIIEARDTNQLILADKIRRVSNELIVTSRALNALKDLFLVIEKSTHTQYPKLIYCMGQIPMMKEIAELAAKHQIKTIISLDPVLVDTQGVCGGRSCKKNQFSKYSAGPDFDANDLDFNELASQFEFLKYKTRNSALTS